MPPHPFSLSENQVTMNRRWCIYPSRTSGGRLWPTVPYIVIQIQHRENMLRLSLWYFVNTSVLYEYMKFVEEIYLPQPSYYLRPTRTRCSCGFPAQCFQGRQRVGPCKERALKLLSCADSRHWCCHHQPLSLSMSQSTAPRRQATRLRRVHDRQMLLF